MESRNTNINSMNAARESGTPADCRMRMAEHIIAQYGPNNSTDIRDILNETKIGAWRRPTLYRMLNTVFSSSSIGK